MPASEHQMSELNQVVSTPCPVIVPAHLCILHKSVAVLRSTITALSLVVGSPDFQQDISEEAMRLLPSLLLFACALCACAQYPRPRRPERFDTAEQISNYLKELQEYYSVHGRGRYGKRQMHVADASVIFRESPIFEHNLNDDPLFKNLGYK